MTNDRGESDGQRKKGLLRIEMRRRLERVASIESRNAGARIASWVVEDPLWQTLDRVALFASLVGEVDTAPLIRAVREAGKLLLLPRIEGTGGLGFRVVDDPTRLVAGPYGTREPPASCPPVDLSAATLVCVPGLAFDLAGGRLGRGAGYYDRALEKLHRRVLDLPTLGLGFSFQLVDRVPMSWHDVRLAGVATEEGLRWIGRDQRLEPRRSGLE